MCVIRIEDIIYQIYKWAVLTSISVSVFKINVDNMPTTQLKISRAHSYC